MATPERIDFFLTDDVRREEAKRGKTRVALRLTPWNDFGYRTTFDTAVSLRGAAFTRIGEWKILDARAPRPVSRETVTGLPKRFPRLPPQFLSLSQKPEQYEALARLDLGAAGSILSGLRDISYVPPRHDLKALPGFAQSLIRFPEAHEAFRRGSAILARLGVLKSASLASPEDILAFDFWCRHTQQDDWTHRADFAFSRGPDQLGLKRMLAMGGSNGAGKTFVLSALARCLTGQRRSQQPL
jgi:hypothetical protein